MEIVEIRERLISLAEPEYGEFVSRGAPSDYPVLGVRIPQIFEFSKEILREEEEDKVSSGEKFGGWKAGLSGEKRDDRLSEKILREMEPRSREEIHLLSFLFAGNISRRSQEVKEKLPKGIEAEFLKIVSRFDSWEMVDIFCSRMKVIKKNREAWLPLIDKLLAQDGEFLVRTGLVLLLDYYVEAEYLQAVFERILRVLAREEYYVKMAVAWLLQGCFVKFPEETYRFMEVSEIPEWTLRKAVSKIQDSRQIDVSWKGRAKELINRGNKR